MEDGQYPTELEPNTRGDFGGASTPIATGYPGFPGFPGYPGFQSYPELQGYPGSPGYPSNPSSPASSGGELDFLGGGTVTVPVTLVVLALAAFKAVLQPMVANMTENSEVVLKILEQQRAELKDAANERTRLLQLLDGFNTSQEHLQRSLQSISEVLDYLVEQGGHRPPRKQPPSLRDPK